MTAAGSVDDYVDGLPDDRKEAIRAVRDVVASNLEAMQRNLAEARQTPSDLSFYSNMLSNLAGSALDPGHLGLRSVRIEHREPRPSTFGHRLAVGDPVTLAQARRRFPVKVPAALGQPTAVYLAENPTRVDMVYRGGPLVTELHATATPVIEKAIGSASKFERLTVGGDRAYFISGANHGFAYIPAGSAEPHFEDQRLAGNTLLVERSDGILLRIEGKLDRDEAVRLAESVG